MKRRVLEWILAIVLLVGISYLLQEQPVVIDGGDKRFILQQI